MRRLLKNIIFRAAVFAAAFVICAGVAAPEAEAKAKSKTARSAGSKKRAVRKVKISGLKSGYVIEKGSVVKLKVKVTPKKAASGRKIKWKSTNKKIAYVSSNNRLVTKKKGTAYVYAVCGGKKSNRIKVIVGHPVVSVDISASSDKVLKGCTLKLKAKVLPRSAAVDSVKWSSSDKKVAKVNSKGTVTAVSAGTAVITARSKDGHNIKGKYKVEVSLLNKEDVRFAAHRGLSYEAPENTLSAYELAGIYGFWGAECDVWETLPEIEGDKTTTRFALSHDNDLSKIYGVNISITKSTPQELSFLKAVNGNNISLYPNEGVPFIEDYLEICARYNMSPVIEIKGNYMSADSVKRLVETVAKYVPLDKAVFASFYTSELVNVQEAVMQEETGPQTILLYSSAHVSEEEINGYSGAVDLAAQKGFSGISVPYKAIDKPLMDHAQEKGVTVSAYTLDSRKKTFNLLQDYNIWAIITDRILFEH